VNFSSGRSTDDINRILSKYGDMLLRIAVVMLKDQSDAEDAVEETIIRYINHGSSFNNGEHEKAWLITVITNQCRDILRYRARFFTSDISCIETYTQDEHTSGILEALMLLPEKFRIVLMLYYVEEYRIDDIASIIGRTTSAVKMRLKKGRELLKEKYTKEFL